MTQTNERLRAALTGATERVTGTRTRNLPGYTLNMISTLVNNPELARAWRDALIAEVPDADERPLDYLISDPADDAFRGVPPTQRAICPDGLNGYVHSALTRPQVNALAEAAGLTGNWPDPMPTTWTALISRGYVDSANFHGITDLGREWLRAAGILPA